MATAASARPANAFFTCWIIPLPLSNEPVRMQLKQYRPAMTFCARTGQSSENAGIHRRLYRSFSAKRRKRYYNRYYVLPARFPQRLRTVPKKAKSAHGNQGVRPCARLGKKDNGYIEAAAPGGTQHSKAVSASRGWRRQRRVYGAKGSFSRKDLRELDSHSHGNDEESLRDLANPQPLPRRMSESSG
jgi:hypothetical protein